MQECFNSPYGHVHFPTYAETINFEPGKEYDIANSASESVKMLSNAAKEHDVWLIGGKPSQKVQGLHIYLRRSGSIPERDAVDSDKLYNTTTVYSPKGLRWQSNVHKLLIQSTRRKVNSTTSESASL